MHKITWIKEILTLTVKNILYISVPFTWLLPEAQKIIDTTRKKCVVGGTAVKLMPDYLEGCDTQDDCGIDWLVAYHPMATRTSVGCERDCEYCAVRKIHPIFKEIKDFVPRPIVCDDNLLLCSKKHFDFLICRLKRLPFVDFNQGLDARLFTSYHAARIAELNNPHVRFAFDDIKIERSVVLAIERAKKCGLKNIGCYVLIGYKDTKDDALQRIKILKELDVMPFVMKYRPLNTTKIDYPVSGWEEGYLKRFLRYWNRQVWLGHIPFDEFSKRNETARLPL